MKQFITIFLLFVSLFIFNISCKSTPHTADSYDNNETTKIEITQKDKDAPRDITVPKTGNAFTNFFTGGQQDIEIDVSRIFQKTTFGSLKEEDAKVIYNIKTGLVGFSAWYRGGFYKLLFTQSTREAFTKAVNQYFSDFENKQLDRKSSRTYKIYGEYPVNIQWGTISTMATNRAKSKVQFGYEFKKNSPYFMLSIPSASNELYAEDRSHVESSANLRFYFTKAMAQQIIQMLSEENINNALEPYMKRIESEGKEVVGDDY